MNYFVSSHVVVFCLNNIAHYANITINNIVKIHITNTQILQQYQQLTW